jgi:NAD(P)-dependent dehydrogenase (short-subunit alcohol dehydrogenase family)
MKLPKDRVVFITGASTGIGRAAAEAFRRDGARVAVCARSEIRDLDAFSIQCDVRNPDEVNRAIQSVIDQFGELHVLVNNAGFGHYTPVEDQSLEDFENIFRTNVFGPFHCVKAALPHLKKTRGQVINISSVLARATVPYMTSYSMTKHALHSFSDGLRIELKPYGIDVIEIGPGLTATKFQSNAKKEGNSSNLVPPNEKGWSAQRVADVIVKASRSGKRVKWLTLEAKVFFFFHHHFPGLVDWALGKWGSRARQAKGSTPPSL